MSNAPDANEQFEGWLCPDASAIQGKMVWDKYTPKKFTDDDVQMDVLACGKWGLNAQQLLRDV